MIVANNRVGHSIQTTYKEGGKDYNHWNEKPSDFGHIFDLWPLRTMLLALQNDIEDTMEHHD